ncbi:hypothetical protein BJ165DRAFT_1407751 [Panaeolus papilionaceus]|nr:hypothetical protein BJ165DRAFT_1407751 [Panaeolus papilionaceus]
MSQIFFDVDEVVPALVTRLALLGITGGTPKSLWCLEKVTSEHVEKMVRTLERLMRLGILMVGKENVSLKLKKGEVEKGAVTKTPGYLNPNFSYTLRGRRYLIVGNAHDMDASNGPLTPEEVEFHPHITVLKKQGYRNYEPQMGKGSVWYVKIHKILPLPCATLHSLPTEALCSILGLIPRANQKDLRFVDKLFNDILKRTLLSSIVFNVHQGNLDLSLFETLATDQNGLEPTGIAVLVKRLTIISLDPRTPSTKEPMTHPPSKVEITICQRRLTSLLGQALYGLRKITHLNKQLVRLEVLNLPCYQQSPRVIGSLNSPSSSTLREVVADLSGFPKTGSVQQLQSIIPHASSLQKLDVELDTFSDLERLFCSRTESCDPNSATSLHITHLGVEIRRDRGCAIPAHMLDRLSPNLQSLKLNASMREGDELEDEPMWTQMQPDHLVSLTSLQTNTLSLCLIRHLVQSFPNLCELALTIVGYHYMIHGDYSNRVLNAFFDDAVPALASRLRKLEINAPKSGAELWCFGATSSDRFKDMILKMNRLKSLKVCVLGNKFTSQGGELQSVDVVNLLVSYVKKNASLRKLIICPMGFTLPEQWSRSAVAGRQLKSSYLLHFPDIYTHQNAWYKPEIDQKDEVIVYRLKSSGEEVNQARFGRINKRSRRLDYY